jgi:hypothetical protein
LVDSLIQGVANPGTSDRLLYDRWGLVPYDRGA